MLDLSSDYQIAEFLLNWIFCARQLDNLLVAVVELTGFGELMLRRAFVLCEASLGVR